MCDWQSAASGTLGIASEILGQRASAKAMQAQMDAQRQAAIKSMNREFMNFEIERQDNFDAAVEDIIKIRQNAMQLNSQVKTAVNENMSGNSANLIIRAAEGDTARSISATQSSYKSKSNEIDLNKETTLLSTKDYIDSINMSAPKMPSGFSNFLTIAGIGLGAYTQGMNNKMQKDITLGKNKAKGNTKPFIEQDAVKKYLQWRGL